MSRSGARKEQDGEDEQVWGEEGAESAVHRVVHPSLVHSAEEIVGVDEAHGVTGLMAE